MVSIQSVIRACRRHILFVGLFSAGINLLYFTPVLYMLQIYDRIIPSRGFETLAFLSLLAVMALAVMGALEAARQRLLARMATRIERLLSDQVIELAFDERASGRGGIHARDLDAFRSALTGPGMLAVLDLPWLPLFLLAVFLVHPYLGLLVLCGSLLLLGISLISQRRMVADIAQGEMITKYANYRIDGALAHAGTAVSMGMARPLAQSLGSDRWIGATSALRANLRGAALSSLAKSTRIGMQCAVLGLGGLLAILGDVNPSAVFAGSILGARALQPMDQLIASWKSLAQGREAFERLKGSIAAAPSRQEASDGAGLTAAGASFALEPGGRTIVHGIDLAVSPGEIVGVIGPSGAGKSTMLKGLAGIAPLIAGEVRIGDGNDQEGTRPNIGYLPQSIDLFAGSVFDNISRFERFSGRDIAEIAEDAVLAAMAIGAHHFIAALPDAYQHQLGENGQGLSGGQGQRIGLARALYGAPPVLLLDEPNANLDPAGEKALMAALEKVRQAGGSVVFVVQRTGLLQICDRVVLMANGRIALDSSLEEVLQITGIEPPDRTQNLPEPAPATEAAGEDGDDAGAAEAAE